ncbi:MAG TPA: hypothetical protein VLM75_06715 [Spirochaetota bacterium]|nr:hypothetical protein [Spirochaetota bacterium]
MANIALVFLLGIVFESAGDLNFSQMLDFIIDSTVSLVFTSAGCYSFVTMARGSLGRILSEADRILTAVDEQKTAFDEISRNISYINQRAQEIAHGSTELSETSRGIEGAVQELVTLSVKA